jgi:ankyrin repeat protein
MKMHSIITAAALLLTELAVISPSSQACNPDRLRRASFVGDVAALRVCFDRGTSPNTRTGDGVTLLMIAAGAGQRDVVNLLLSKSVDVNARTTRDGVTATMFAVVFGHLPIVQLLSEQGHADLDAKDDSDRRTVVEWTAVRGSLPWATRGNSEEESALSTAIMRYLVSRGAVVRDIDIVESLLIFAAVPDLSRVLEDAVPSQ